MDRRALTWYVACVNPFFFARIRSFITFLREAWSHDSPNPAIPNPTQVGATGTGFRIVIGSSSPGFSSNATATRGSSATATLCSWLFFQLSIQSLASLLDEPAIGEIRLAP